MKHVWKFTLPAHILGISSLCWVVHTGQYWFIAAAVAMWALMSIGVEVGIHRLFSHSAFKTYRWVEVLLMYFGSIAGQGSVPFWVAVHRTHHPHSDTQKDPHSPVKGAWQAYVGWLIDDTQEKISYRTVVPLMRDRMQKFFHDHYYKVILVTAVALAAVHPLLAGMYFLATTIAIQQNFIINVVCHSEKFGYATYETSDRSRNVGWLCSLSWGLSLHNNHHHDPGNWNLARGSEWDPSAWVIRLISTSRREARD